MSQGNYLVSERQWGTALMKTAQNAVNSLICGCEYPITGWDIVVCQVMIVSVVLEVGSCTL